MERERKKEIHFPKRKYAINGEVLKKLQVTLEGDIFLPIGLLIGGSRRGHGDLLGQLCELADAESNLSIHQKKLSDIEAEIARLLPLQKKFIKVNDDLKLKEYELQLFERRSEQIEHHNLAETVKRSEQDLAYAKSALKEKQLQYESSLEKVGHQFKPGSVFFLHLPQCIVDAILRGLLFLMCLSGSLKF